MTRPPFILLDDQLSGKVRHYENPVEIISAYTQKELSDALQVLQSRLDQGWFAAGYISYEAGLCLESKLQNHITPSEQPLLLMGIFDHWSAEYPEAPL